MPEIIVQNEKKNKQENYDKKVSTVGVKVTWSRCDHFRVFSDAVGGKRFLSETDN